MRLTLFRRARKVWLRLQKKFAEELIKNPILPYEEGEDRVLRGFKIQFESRDGRYNCVDVDLPTDENVRPVNINTIQWLIIDGKKVCSRMRDYGIVLGEFIYSDGTTEVREVWITSNERCFVRGSKLNTFIQVEKRLIQDN